MGRFPFELGRLDLVGAYHRGVEILDRQLSLVLYVQTLAYTPHLAPTLSRNRSHVQNLSMLSFSDSSGEIASLESFGTAYLSEYALFSIGIVTTGECTIYPRPIRKVYVVN